MITNRIIGALAFMIAVSSALAVNAQQSNDPRVADLVQSGKLRVGIGLGTPALATPAVRLGGCSDCGWDCAHS